MSVSEPTCFSCAAPLTRVFDGAVQYEQYDNALHLRFAGGYGEFVDAPFHSNPRGEGEQSLRAVICHDCAHQLCEQVPWIGELLQPARSHTHRTGAEHD